MQEKLQPLEDEAGDIAGGGEDGVGLIAETAYEEVAVQMAVGLGKTDDSLDRRAAPKLLLDPSRKKASPIVDAKLRSGKGG